MDWSNERYVRLYTRDTVDWCLWPWQARALFPLLLRKMDRAGNLAVGKHGAGGIAELVRMPVEHVTAGLDALLSDGVVTMRDGVVTMPNFIVAQESKASDALRAKNHREKVKALGGVTPCDAGVTKRDDCVTTRHTLSQTVTPSLAVPSLAEPSQASKDSGAVAPPPETVATPKADKPAKKTADPRHASTVDLLTRTWSSVVGTAYAFQGARDGAAVKRLLALPDATDAEIERRFRAYLADGFNVRQASLAHFAAKWSGCVAPAAASRQRDPRYGMARAEDQHHPDTSITGPVPMWFPGDPEELKP